MMFAVSDSRKDIINAEFADCNRNLAKKVASKPFGSSIKKMPIMVSFLVFSIDFLN